jgi:hypothetical protein
MRWPGSTGPHHNPPLPDSAIEAAIFIGLVLVLAGAGTWALITSRV